MAHLNPLLTLGVVPPPPAKIPEVEESYDEYFLEDDEFETPYVSIIISLSIKAKNTHLGR